jgi:hypothetical protein
LKTLINSCIISVKWSVPRDGQKFYSPNTLLGYSRREMSFQHLEGENAEIVYYFDNAAEA